MRTPLVVHPCILLLLLLRVLLSSIGALLLPHNL
jgi:hypothetical protein